MGNAHKEVAYSCLTETMLETVITALRLRYSDPSVMSVKPIWEMRRYSINITDSVRITFSSEKRGVEEFIELMSNLDRPFVLYKPDGDTLILLFVHNSK